MPRRSLITNLPKDVRLQLHQRLIDSNFSDYVEHSDWLLSLGYEISKSSINRYCLENADQIRLSVSVSEKSSKEIRLRCLELAERLIEIGRAHV